MTGKAGEHLERLDERQQQLVNDHRYVVQRVVRRYGSRIAGSMSRSDAEQQSQLGLIYAARVFDAHLGVPFAAFAWTHCVGTLLRELYREKRHHDVAKAVIDCMCECRREGDVLTATPESAHDEARRHAQYAMMAFTIAAAHTEGTRDEEERAIHDETQRAIRAATGRLEGDLRRVIELHYGEDTDMVSVAKQLGMTYPTARRRRAAALSLLKWDLGTQASTP